jgi:hypothetical protein
MALSRLDSTALQIEMPGFAGMTSEDLPAVSSSIIPCLHTFPNAQEPGPENKET